ncbi:hypothetical protein BJ508DRAFT_330844 [Ascobolus immersus RN42]|uniref:Uncharacterized protein n=1 Tax=Ascobolus immersus RN42 TaxID=1160509 RepID=A0A3N4HS94_ASCIM|nr:hypothetical protein BJ508DRAFT_330844 [Ascobolus immersus RN42]
MTDKPTRTTRGSSKQPSSFQPPPSTQSSLDPIAATGLPSSQSTVQIPATPDTSQDFSTYGSYDPARDQLRHTQPPLTAPRYPPRHPTSRRTSQTPAVYSTIHARPPAQPSLLGSNPPSPPPPPSSSSSTPPPSTSPAASTPLPPSSPPSLGPISLRRSLPPPSQPFNVPNAVQRVLRGHISGLSATVVTSIFNGTFKALDLCKLRPDLLRQAYGLDHDNEQRYLTFQDGVLTTAAFSSSTTVKEKLSPYASYAAFTRYWTIYTYVMTSLFGTLSPNLVYGLNLHLYNITNRQQNHHWSAILNYHFTHHQRLLDDGHTALLNADNWAVMDPHMVNEYLGGDTYRSSSKDLHHGSNGYALRITTPTHP